VITEEEHHSIVERSLEIYFGPQWREGKISLLPASKLRVREGIAGGPGNPYIVTLLMLRTALTRGDEVLFLQVFRLVDSYLTALNEADRFRDMYTISQEVFHLLESTGKKPEVAKVAYRYGYSLRMLGHHEESIRILEKALEYAPPQFGEEWQASVYLSLALAHVSCKDEDMAIAAAKAVQERTVADSAQAYQAQSVLLKCMAGEDWAPNTFAKLADLEQKARRKGYLVVANNIALDLAQQTDNTAERNRLRARVLQTKEDVYNRIRATIAKAEELAKAGRQNDVTVQERRFLNEAYSYLYLQRLGNLFERCHDDLWQIASTEVGSPLLLRLFRFSSFLWRVFGKTTRERQYLRQLKHVCDPGTVRSLERDREEVSYYLTRLRVLDE